MTTSKIRNSIAAATLASASVLTASSSFADKPLFRNINIGGGINAATLAVDQENGRWTKMNRQSIRIPIHIDIQMSRGYIVFYRIGRNLTNGAVRGIMLTHANNSGTKIEAKIDAKTSVKGPMNIFVGAGRRLNPTDEQAIISRCNTKPGKLNSGHSFSYTLPLAMHVDARRRRRPHFPLRFGEKYKAFGDFARGTAVGRVIVKVVCRGYSKPSKGSAKGKAPSGPVKPGVHILGASIRPKSPTAKTCPRKFFMQGSIQASRKQGQSTRYVSYAVEKNGVRGNWSRKKMSWNGKAFMLKVFKEFSVGPGRHNIRLILKNGKKSKVIQTTEVTCPSLKVLSVKLQYNVVGGNKCPKKVWETATFTTTAPGQIKYRIVNKAKQNLHTGWTLAKNHGGVYKAVAQRVLTMKAYNGTRGVQVLNRKAKTGWTVLKVNCPALPKRSNGPKSLTDKKRQSHNANKPARFRAQPTQRKVTSIRCRPGFVLKNKRCIRPKPKRVRRVACKPGFKKAQGRCIKIRRNPNRINPR